MTSYINSYADASGAMITISGLIASGEVSFFAFITSFSDNVTSNWNEEQVYGRQDPIGTFQSTTRKISLGFDLPAANLAEAMSKHPDADLAQLFSELHGQAKSLKKRSRVEKAVNTGFTVSASILIVVAMIRIVGFLRAVKDSAENDR